MDEDYLYNFQAQNPTILFVKWLWTSCNAFPYCRVTTMVRCVTLARQHTSLKAHISCIGGFALLGALDPVFSSPTGRASIFPDWKSIRALDSTHAAIQCRVAEDLTLYRQLSMPSPFQRCPKSSLERIVILARERYSLVMLAGFELEFYLFNLEDFNLEDLSAGGNRKFPQRTWSSAASARGPQAQCVEACMTAMDKAGILVEQAHAESSPDQFEISIGPLPLVEAADSLLYSKEIILEVARSHGFRAIFMPKPLERLEPTGLHLHLSIHSIPSTSSCPPIEELIGSNTRQRYEIFQKDADAFLAGILHRLSALLAFSMPSDNSYRRISTTSAMGFHVAWGKNNSSVPLSEVSIGYWEIRSLDWTANIHLAIAAYVSAGLLGMKERQHLGWHDPGACTYDIDAASLELLGITTLLPKSFPESLSSLISMKYAGLELYMGEELLDLYVLVKQSEQQYFSSLTEIQVISLLMEHI